METYNLCASLVANTISHKTSQKE